MADPHCFEGCASTSVRSRNGRVPLVMIGARPDPGGKELSAVRIRYGESADSWRAPPRVLKWRGTTPSEIGVPFWELRAPGA